VNRKKKDFTHSACNTSAKKRRGKRPAHTRTSTIIPSKRRRGKRESPSLVEPKRGRRRGKRGKGVLFTGRGKDHGILI